MKIIRSIFIIAMMKVIIYICIYVYDDIIRTVTAVQLHRSYEE